MSIEAVVAALESFVPSDDGDVYHLYQILDGFDSMANRERAIPAMFSLFERYPEGDFGAPGPLVHALAAIPGYQPFLVASLARKPTRPTVSMVNAILNSPLRSLERES
jgi:hypothetical protein